MEPVRRAITTPYNRRNADYNPCFLDKDSLLKRFTPLIQSIHRYFCSYVGILDQPCDVADLYNQIQLEFLKLTQKFDPKRGVDFPGYIKFNLRHRIYYYVMKLQKRQNTEQLVRQYGLDEDVDTVAYDAPDESVAMEFFRKEALVSIPWDKLTQEQRELVKDICYEHMGLDQIAKKNKKTLRSVQIKFNELCEVLIRLYKKDSGDEYYERDSDPH